MLSGMSAISISIFVMSVILIGIAVVMAIYLPDRVAIHWALDGTPDSHGSKWILVVACIAPLIAFGVLELLLSLSIIEMPVSKIQEYQKVFLAVLLVFIAAMFYAFRFNIGKPISMWVVMTPVGITLIYVFFIMGLKSK